MVVKKTQKKKPPNPKTNALNLVFEKAGFTHIPSDLLDLTLQGLTSEIDHIFAHDNLLVLCEKTTGANISEHFAKKKDFHEKINSHRVEFIKEYRKVNQAFSDHLDALEYEPRDFEIRSIYYSENKSFGEGILSNPGAFILMSAEICKYFRDLTNVINKSAKFEIFKYLNVELAQIGDLRISGQHTPSLNFPAFVLPGQHTNYPEDFILVSFYIDPDTLVKQAYVLRRDGWENSQISYQRFVKKTKLQQMRDYLANDGAVFINNLIITLPNAARLTDSATKATLRAEQIEKLQHVNLSIPNELGTIGIVDGQHRVLAYYEGEDTYEPRIARIRRRQNLLATGIIFPENYTPEERVKFEAALFLKINNTQTGVSDALKQELETIINPSSAIAIAKQITSVISSNSPLAGHIQSSIYDGADKVKTASFARYALLPLVNPEGANSLFAVWSEKTNRDMKSSDNRSKYVDFCRKIISLCLAGLKVNLNGKWGQQSRINKSFVLTPTSIGGAFVYLRLMIENKVDIDTTDFSVTFKGVTGFDFSAYRSSKWVQLGKALYLEHPPIKQLDPSDNN